MSSQTTSHRTGPAHPAAAPDSGWATSAAVFAAILMMLAGVLGVLVGVAAILRDEIYVVTPQYVVGLDVTVWGWVHLGLAVLLGAAGAGVVWGRDWARVVGVGVAGLNLIAHFAFLPFYPVWSLVIIALDVLVIWALAVYPGEPD
ncbi:hypothetical protein PSU4_01300 [Pseudonocardia sulfidoxydans NBRC 16205]|uniref:DUF7144 domain-containing protein n=1 Tax=Pseudonocardia sulfidoxydans NBRC 16205 TaxID=1223511 RepID=A0A511D8R3_9PSEU|nr:hypothetical protein [Pseudonocardia sulfidoxydans]GEL21176.1 hypothetical protein PSU4_01300 [Pseudonocardia sulfidoxydans NBRC 16205]